MDRNKPNDKTSIPADCQSCLDKLTKKALTKIDEMSKEAFREACVRAGYQPKEK